jgi:hypothetical protein
MSPETVAAIARLREDRILSDAQAEAFGRVARGDLLSVRGELRLMLYAGVLLLTTGAGIFLKENHDRIGPAAIAAAVGAAALGCLWYAARRLPPFSWGAVQSPHVAADYVLVLAMLLIGADLAYVESQFRVLGPNWAYHLLIVSIVYLVAAYRFDSRAVLTLALTSFAAWRGVSVGMPFGPSHYEAAARSSAGVVRANAIAVGLLYVAVGVFSARARRKAHFEPVWVAAGMILVFGGVLTGVLGDGDAWIAWLATLAILGSVALLLCWRLRRPLEFAIATAALYVGGFRLLGEITHGQGALLIVAAWSTAALVFLIRATRRLRSTE